MHTGSMVMTEQRQRGNVIAPGYTGPRLFGAPVGDFGVFQTVLLTAAAGFVSFFASTFLAIMTLLVVMSTGRKVDFSLAYRWVGLPVGIVMMLAAGIFLGSALVGRLRRSGSQ